MNWKINWNVGGEAPVIIKADRITRWERLPFESKVLLIKTDLDGIFPEERIDSIAEYIASCMEEIFRNNEIITSIRTYNLTTIAQFVHGLRLSIDNKNHSLESYQLLDGVKIAVTTISGNGTRYTIPRESLRVNAGYILEEFETYYNPREPTQLIKRVLGQNNSAIIYIIYDATDLKNVALEMYKSIAYDHYNPLVYNLSNTTDYFIAFNLDIGIPIDFSLYDRIRNSPYNYNDDKLFAGVLGSRFFIKGVSKIIEAANAEWIERMKAMNPDFNYNEELKRQSIYRDCKHDVVSNDNNGSSICDNCGYIVECVHKKDKSILSQIAIPIDLGFNICSLCNEKITDKIAIIDYFDQIMMRSVSATIEHKTESFILIENEYSTLVNEIGLFSRRSGLAGRKNDIVQKVEYLVINFRNEKLEEVRISMPNKGGAYHRGFERIISILALITYLVYYASTNPDTVQIDERVIAGFETRETTKKTKLIDIVTSLTKRIFRGVYFADNQLIKGMYKEYVNRLTSGGLDGIIRTFYGYITTLYEFVGDYKIIYNVRSVNDMTIPKNKRLDFYSSLLSSAERKYKENSVIDIFRDHPSIMSWRRWDKYTTFNGAGAVKNLTKLILDRDSYYNFTTLCIDKSGREHQWMIDRPSTCEYCNAKYFDTFTDMSEDETDELRSSNVIYRLLSIHKTHCTSGALHDLSYGLCLNCGRTYEEIEEQQGEYYDEIVSNTKLLTDSTPSEIDRIPTSDVSVRGIKIDESLDELVSENPDLINKIIQLSGDKTNEFYDFLISIGINRRVYSNQLKNHENEMYRDRIHFIVKYYNKIVLDNPGIEKKIDSILHDNLQLLSMYLVNRFYKLIIKLFEEENTKYGNYAKEILKVMREDMNRMNYTYDDYKRDQLLVNERRLAFLARILKLTKQQQIEYGIADISEIIMTRDKILDEIDGASHEVLEYDDDEEGFENYLETEAGEAAEELGFLGEEINEAMFDD